MSAAGHLTDKGERRAMQILDAALRSLATCGYGQTSIQRVADEAAVQKRVVLYYFPSREALFDAVVRRLGDQLFDDLENRLIGLEEPEDIVQAGFDTLWTAVTTDRALLIAWFGLRAEAITNPTLRATASYITDRFRMLVTRLVDDALARGRRPVMDRAALEILIVACSQGLLLDYLERGETVALHKGLHDFQRWLALVTVPASS